MSAVGALSLTSILAAGLNAGVSYSAANEFEEYGPGTGSTKTYLDNFDVSEWRSGGSYSTIETYSSKDFAGKYHRKLGLISRPSDSRISVIETMPTYDSWWDSSAKTDTQDIETYRYETFFFEKYFDAPVETYETVRVNAGDSRSFKMTYTETESCAQTETSEKGSSAYFDFSSKYNFKAGSGIDFDLIKSQWESSSETEIRVGSETYQKVTNTKTSETHYSTVYEETFVMDNSNSSTATFYQFCQRQKFKVYFTAAYKMDYETTQWGSGAFNLDQNWKYDINGFVGIETYYYLIPVETPYFEVSLYKENSEGLREYVGSQNDMVYRA